MLNFSEEEIKRSPSNGSKSWFNKRYLSRMREIEIYRNAADYFSILSNNQLTLKDNSSKVIRKTSDNEMSPFYYTCSCY